jgi:stage III sporulation protein AF
MMDFLKTWVLNIVSIAIFIVLLEILIPSGKTRKFVNLVAGFVLIIAIISPLLGLINKDFDINDLQIADSNFIDKKEIEISSKALEESQVDQITEVYRQKLIKQIEDSVDELDKITCVKADVIINEDYKSDSFGDIKRAYIEISKEKVGDEGVSEIETVKNVQIEVDNSEYGKEDKGDKLSEKKIDAATEKKIKDKVKNHLGIDEENVVVSLL